MRSIKDSNGNLQKAQYGPSTAGNYLTYLIDPTGARMDFGYGKDNNLGNLNANGISIYFSYFEVSEEDKNNYCIKQNSRYFMIPSLSHEENTAINGAYPTVEAMSPQEFILEKCSERMTAQYT